MPAIRPVKPGIHVWLVASHPLAARYLQQILRAAGITVATKGGWLPTENELAGGCPVFVIDALTLAMPLAQTLRVLRTKFPGAKVLLIGSQIEKDELCRLLFLGIRGFIAYEEIEGMLARAVQRVRDGHLSVPADALEQFTALAAARQRRMGPALSPFTPRECLILGLLQRRLSNKEISSALGIAERTVKFHLQNIFAKLGTHDRGSALDLAGDPQVFEAEAA